MRNFYEKEREMSPVTKALVGTGTVLGSAALVGGILFGGRELGWWLKTDNTNRQSHLIRNSYSNQQTLREQITKNLSDVDAIDLQLSQNPPNAEQLTAQQKAIKDQICLAETQVSGDPLPEDQGIWVESNCKNGHSE